MELIRIENLYKTYHLGEVDVPVLRGVSLTIQHGELVALMGASGSGKTTLMNILGCLDRPSSGEYWLDGEELSGLTPDDRALVRTAKLGFVFQSFNLLSRTTAVANVTMPLDYAPKWPSQSDAQRLAISLLQRVGLGDRLDHEPSQMSGGQQQRVAIARSLVNKPALVLADEPTGNLDSKTSVEILEMFRDLNAEGITVVLVTHDPKVATYADRVIRIKDGQVESDGPPEQRAEYRSRPSNVLPPPIPFQHPTQNGANGNGHDGNGHIGNGLNYSGNGDSGNGHAAPSGHGGALSGVSSGTSHGQTAVLTANPKTISAQAEPYRPVTNLEFAEAMEPQPGDKHKLAWDPLAKLPPTFRTALHALRRNKMRSLLTALGVIIGVGAVIAMVEIGQGSKTAIQKQIASMGANTLLLNSGAATSGGISFGSGTTMTLTPQDAIEVAAQCPAVAEVAPIVRTRVQLVYQSRNWQPTFIYGTTPGFFVVRDWMDLDEGELFTDGDVAKAAQVCLIGETIRRELFDGESVVGREFRMNNVTFRVIGVLTRKGANSFGMDQDDIVVAPWTSIKYRVSGAALASSNQSSAAAKDTSQQVNTLNNRYAGSTALYASQSAAQMADRPQPVRFANVDQILLKANTAEEIPLAIEQASVLLRERHHILQGRDDDFNLRDMTEITKALSATSQLMSMLLLVVALISLVVGGVGIMNIMLVSVTERTREIGLRMAVGARSYHILRQFLVEAVVLCVLGGGVGILVGSFASYLVRYFLHWPTSPSIPAIVGAFAVSATVGVVFGFYPAWKASRLDPIEALRYE